MRITPVPHAYPAQPQPNPKTTYKLFNSEGGEVKIGDVVRSEVGLALDNARMVEREFWNEGLRQLLEENRGPSKERLFADMLKSKKMTQDEYNRLEGMIKQYPDLEEDAFKMLADWKGEGKTQEQAMARVKHNQRYRDYFEVKDFKQLGCNLVFVRHLSSPVGITSSRSPHRRTRSTSLLWRRP